MLKESNIRFVQNLLPPDNQQLPHIHGGCPQIQDSVVVYRLSHCILGGGAESYCCCQPQARPGFHPTASAVVRSRANYLVETSVWSVKNGIGSHLWWQEIVDTMCAVYCSSPTSYMLYLLDHHTCVICESIATLSMVCRSGSRMYT